MKSPSVNAQKSRLTPAMVALMAVATGACVANNYYAQPLLGSIGSTLGISSSAAATIVTVGQGGYAAGLVFLLPLGDVIHRRRLIVGMSLLAAVGSAVSASATGLAALMIGTLLTGACSVVAQILVPLVSVMADERDRGRAVGTVMSGLLLGILLARTVSGFISEAGSWRTVYWFAAAVMVLLAGALYRGLPNLAPAAKVKYPTLLASTLRLVRDEPLLRVRMTYGFLSYVGFSLLWTALTLLLSAPPFNYSGAIIGIFGLVGAAGALGARVAGDRADRGQAGLITAISVALLAASWAVLVFAQDWLGAVVIGIILLDLGTQLLHITNQHQIYRLQPEARSRLTSAYMSAYFVGGALGSVLASTAFAAGGWSGVVVAGGLDAALLITAWLVLNGTAAGTGDSG